MTRSGKPSDASPDAAEGRHASVVTMHTHRTASLGFPLLVNYDVPKTKEAYARRARVALGGGKGGAGRGGIVRAPGVVVTLVVADDETELLREVCGDSRVETMPVSALEEVAMNWFAYINNSGIR